MIDKNSPYQWDHVVHYVNDLNAVTETFKQQGINVFIGGSHKLWGTHNSLGYFGLTYLEFLSVEHPEVAKNPPEPNLIAQTALSCLPENDALSRVALRTDDIEATVQSLTGKGLHFSEIKAGKRTDASGRLIEWKMLTIEGDFHGLLYPFFIEWKETDEERLAVFEEKGILDHPAGSFSITSAVFEVSSPEEAAAHWEELFGLKREIGKHATFLAVDDKAFVFQKGPQNALTEIHFQTDADALKGRTITIGTGKYVF